MHASLTVPLNLTTQALAGAGMAVALLALSPTHPEICLLSLALGALAGWLQSQAIRQTAEALRTATSAGAVRAVLKTSVHGRWSLGITWANGLALITLLLMGLINVDSAIAAYAAFLFARELGCLPAVKALNAVTPS